VRLIICWALQVYFLILLARIVLSWFPATGGALDGVQRVLFKVTEPVLGPIRSVLPPVRIGAMGLDLSPMIVIIVISVLIGYLA